MSTIYIQTAVKRALNKNKFIMRKAYEFMEIKIKPTNTPDCCICFIEGKPSAKRWNPKAEDLIANDWIMLD